MNLGNRTFRVCMTKTLDEVISAVMRDLESLEKLADDLLKQWPKAVGFPVSDELYMAATGVHVMCVSQLEYLLRFSGKITVQSDIPQFIQNVKSLNQLEKDHLIYLFLTRHTLVHNGGHYDDKFFKSVKKLIRELKVEVPNEQGSLSLIGPDQIKMYIGLITKLIKNEFHYEGLLF